jgi:SAM-dependent methyltransferase
MLVVTAAWTSGYVGDVSYTLGYNPEQAPSFLNYACLINGIEGLPGRKLRYCDLGCGRGYGTTVLAAANPEIDFVGIDFNPAHVAEARRFAERSGITNVTFLETSFGDAAGSSDPRIAEFDVIAVYGVYSWVEPSIRADIHQFIRTKLLPGGLMYVHYMILPGFASLLPVRQIIGEIAKRAPGDSIAKARVSQQFLRNLIEKPNAFVSQNPRMKDALEQLVKQEAHYFAHESLTRGWHPMFVTEAMAALADAKLTYVASAAIGENRLELCAQKEWHEAVLAAPDIAMRELLKDYALNKQARRDIYVKGPQVLPRHEHRQRLLDIPFGLISNSKEPPPKVRVPIAEISIKKEVANAVWACVQEKPATGTEIVAAAGKAGAKEQDVWRLIEIWVHGKLISPGLPGAADGAAARRLNKTVMEMSLAADTHHYLASPALGSAIHASFLDRVVAPLLSNQERVDDMSIAEQVYDRLVAFGQRPWRHSKAMERNAGNFREIAQSVREFRELRLPRWRAIGVV